MSYAERIAPPLSRNSSEEEMNRFCPALSRESLPEMREKTAPALSDRLLNAPEVQTSPTKSNVLERPITPERPNVPPRPPVPERPTTPERPMMPPHPVMTMTHPMPRKTPAPTLQMPPVPMQPTVQPPAPPRKPSMLSPVTRGQKTALRLQERGCTRLRLGFGWETADARCDVDASAFLLGENGCVLSDGGFVFYGQQISADGSVCFRAGGAADRETMTVDFARLDQRIRRIVFVLTIDGALTQKLHFGMLRDVYLRILDDRDGREILSYPLENAFENVTSMTLGELYLHQGQWKFNPIGNGVSTDLAGQCALYGVTLA